MDAPAVQSHQCEICYRVFSRLEHLQRHTRTHSDARPFGCSFCRRSFSRKDAAHRHERTRHGPEGQKIRVPRLRRACVCCALARVSCSGELPCSNCDSKQQQCVYERRKTKHSSARQPNSPVLEMAVDVINEAGGDDGATPLAHGATRPDLTSEPLLKENGAITQEDLSLPDGHSPHCSELEDVHTAMNWLPFDYGSIEGQPDNSTSPHSSISGSGSHATALSRAIVVSHEREIQTYPLETDSLASLIASMGRASQPFGNRFSSRALSGAEKPAGLAGSLYSDGTGGRTSQAERAMYLQRAQQEASLLAKSTGSVATPGSECSWMQALETGLPPVSPSDQGRLYRIPELVYSDIQSRVDTRISFCSSNALFDLRSRSFPSRDTLSTFVRLYFDHFHPVYPFLDLPLLNMPVWGWSLCLATAAIGCRYSSCPQKDTCADALSVVLREILVQELQFSLVEFNLSHAQALLLNTLALCQSSDTSVMALGEEAISSAMNWCRRFCLLQEPEGQIDQSMQIEGDTNQMWTAWRCREMRRRTGLFAWMLDIALSLTRYAPSVLNIQALDLLMPSDEVLWEADSAFAWHQAYSPRHVGAPHANDFNVEESGRPSFATTIATLYENLKLVEGLSQFASTACIYALFHGQWDMTRLFQGPFLVPDRAQSGLTSQDSALASYPAATLAFTSWRNKACDYMDVIHWEALGNSAKAGGLEGPIFLHLHLGRLVLLTPVKEFFTLVDHRLSSSSPGCFVQLPHNVAWQPGNLQRGQQFIQTWAQRDRYKARLAVVHAGATLWHVRRYATDSFVQPFTVYLAAIVLHFYAKETSAEQRNPEISDAANMNSYEGEVEPDLKRDTGQEAPILSQVPPTRPVQRPSREAPKSSRRTSRMPAYYNVDRPVDDEMVQHFVRDENRSITLCAEGIPDLCSAQGARQILLEAASLLDAGNVVWPIAQKYAVTLRAMATADGADESVSLTDM